MGGPGPPAASLPSQAKPSTSTPAPVSLATGEVVSVRLCGLCAHTGSVCACLVAAQHSPLGMLHPSVGGMKACKVSSGLRRSARRLQRVATGLTTTNHQRACVST